MSDKAIIELLKVAACPANCTDGAYADNYGEPVQCQFCYEREQLIGDKEKAALSQQDALPTKKHERVVGEVTVKCFTPHGTAEVEGLSVYGLEVGDTLYTAPPSTAQEDRPICEFCEGTGVEGFYIGEGEGYDTEPCSHCRNPSQPTAQGVEEWIKEKGFEVSLTSGVLLKASDVRAFLSSPPLEAFKGWYCAHCQRGVDATEVTFSEQHEVCGRVITNDTPPPLDGMVRVPINKDVLGQAINDFFADLDNGDGTLAFDHCSANDIDLLADAVIKAASKGE